MRVGNLLRLLAAAPVVVEAVQNITQQSSAHTTLTLSINSTSSFGDVDAIFNNLRNTNSCSGCQMILVLLKSLAKKEKLLVDVLQSICRLAKHADDDVCDGFLDYDRQGKELARVIREVKLYEATSKIFCNAVLGLCPIPERQQGPERWFFGPRKKYQRPEVNRRQPPLKVAHFSDIHIDPHYTTGASTDCSKPICCRVYTDKDEPGVTKNPASPFGDHKCDSPVSLEQSMYRTIHDFDPEIDFAIFTGDAVDHAVWNTSKQSVTEDLENAFSRMQVAFNVLYSTVGNHDMHPANIFTLPKLGEMAPQFPYHINWLYKLLGEHWTKWTGLAEMRSFRYRGSYMTKFCASEDRVHTKEGFDGRGPKLRIISLNTNLYYRYNFGILSEKLNPDPSQGLGYLVEQLKAAERAGDRVYIIGHMPMGDIDALHDASWSFDKIVNHFASTIAGMFFGHTHSDHFELHYNTYDKRTAANARVVSYIAPAMTPTSGNPAFRVYDVDRDTFAVLDSVTYMADMDDPTFATAGPLWKPYYSAREAYGPLVDPPLPAGDELTPAFWHNVTELLQRNETAFNEYIVRKSRGWKPQECTGKCREDEICRLRAGRAQDNCYTVGDRSKLPKRDQIGNNAHDDCGHSVAAEVLGHLATNKAALQLLKDASDKFGAEMNATSFSVEHGWI